MYWDKRHGIGYHFSEFKTVTNIKYTLPVGIVSVKKVLVGWNQ